MQVFVAVVVVFVVVFVVVVVVVDRIDVSPRQQIPTQREPFQGFVVARVDTRLAAPSTFAVVGEGV